MKINKFATKTNISEVLHSSGYGDTQSRKEFRSTTRSRRSINNRRLVEGYNRSMLGMQPIFRPEEEYLDDDGQRKKSTYVSKRLNAYEEYDNAPKQDTLTANNLRRQSFNAGSYTNPTPSAQPRFYDIKPKFE